MWKRWSRFRGPLKTSGGVQCKGSLGKLVVWFEAFGKSLLDGYLSELNNIQMTVAVTNDQQYILCYKHAYKMVSSFTARGCSCLSWWPHFMGHRWAFMCALFNANLSAHISWVFLRSSDWCDVMWCHHHGSFCGQSKWWLSASRSLMSLAAQLTSTVTHIILLSDVSMMCCTRVS